MKNVILQSFGLDLVNINVYATVYRSVLFLLFINDLPLFINEIYLDIYADDTTVHAADKGSKIVKKETSNRHKWILNLGSFKPNVYKCFENICYDNWYMIKLITGR